MSGERKYALVRLKAGDYILPSNDGQTLWRIARYTDGPSSGLDLPRDREFWGVWRWTGRVIEGEYLDTEDWQSWEFFQGMYDARSEAIDAALRVGADTPSGQTDSPHGL